MTDHIGHSIPMPSDPTELTVRMLVRELNNQREVFEAVIEGRDRIVERIQIQLDGLHAGVTAEVSHLNQLHQEQFSSIQTQFRERDTRTEQSSKDSKVAVDAALQAAKEAVGEQNKSSALAIAKSEGATTKQIDQIGITMLATTQNLNDKIDDVKARLLMIDGLAKGGKDNSNDQRSNIAIAVAVMMAVVTVGAMVYASGKSGNMPAQATPQVIYLPQPPPLPVLPAK